MGVHPPSSLGRALFGPVQARLLGLLFGQPDRRWRSAELVRDIGAGSGAVHRQLEPLVAAGLVLVEREGRSTFYRPAPDSPIRDELVSLVRKTVGLADPLRDALAPWHDEIQWSAVYGSVAAGRDGATSDIDLLVVSPSLSHHALYEALVLAERALARRIEPRLVTPAQLTAAAADAGSFLYRVLHGPLVTITGSVDAALG